MMKPEWKRERSFQRSRELHDRFHATIPGGSHIYAKGDDQLSEFMAPYILRGEAATYGMWMEMNSLSMGWDFGL